MSEAQLAAPASAAAGGVESRWGAWALWAILGVTALRLAWNTLELAPLHFDESQYWTYGEAIDWGYYSKPPMVAWLIRASTEIFGDTPFGVRFFAPLLHAGVAAFVYVAAQRLFDARTGFWAALIYLAAPGVSVSSTVMSTDPPMMLAWAAALYALARILTLGGPEGRMAGTGPWWIALGVAIGFGMLSKYTIIAFMGGALGYALFARQAGPIWRAAPARAQLWGPLTALAAALVVFSPNLAWNAAHDFASFTHLGDNAKLGHGVQFRFDKLGEFFGAQFGVFGPISFLALLALPFLGRWRHEWQFRLLLWLTLPLLIAMCAQAFISRAHPNWAAPIYIAGSILVAAWLLDLGRRAWLTASVALGAAAAALFLAGVSVIGPDASALPRAYDPLKKTRHYHAICARAMALRGDLRLISGDRKLMADCLWAGRLGVEEARMLPTDTKTNHYALTIALDPDGAAARGERFLLVQRGGVAAAEALLANFEEADLLEQGEARTHADRSEPYILARVRGWRGER
ncbi:MAG: glycosyltransferase family 39 protein [Pseudomonadota bacterium]